jgi:hypothetical protein
MWKYLDVVNASQSVGFSYGLQPINDVGLQMVVTPHVTKSLNMSLGPFKFFNTITNQITKLEIKIQI